MFSGKLKAVTFSYDDGVTQDVRLIKILNKYGLKSTFNLNSGLFGQKDTIGPNNAIDHIKIPADKIAEIYKGHEIAVHTLTHPNLTTLDEAEIVKQVEDDRLALEKIAGYPVVGMAYPCGGINNNDFVADVLKRSTKMQYARTITSSYSFDLQDNLLQFNPTVYHMEPEKMFELAERFLALTPDEPKLFYIWGHSYEFDFADTWSQFEKFCALISGHSSIFYGTNREVLLKSF